MIGQKSHKKTKDAQVSQLKRQVRNLEQQIAQRHPKYYDRPPRSNSVDNTPRTFNFKLRSQESIDSPAPEYDQWKLPSPRPTKRSNFSFQKAIDITIPFNHLETGFSEHQSQYTITQQDSENLQDDPKIKSIVLKQKDLQIANLTKKVEDLNQRLNKEIDLKTELQQTVKSLQSEKRLVQEHLQKPQSVIRNRTSTQTIGSMCNLVSQLDLPLAKDKLAWSSENEIRQHLEKDQERHKQQRRSHQAQVEQNGKLKGQVAQLQKDCTSLKQKNKHLTSANEEFVKAYSKMKQEKEALQILLHNQKKFQSYLTQEPIIENESEYRPSSSRLSSNLQESPFSSEGGFSLFDVIQQLIRFARQNSIIRNQIIKMPGFIDITDFEAKLRRVQNIVLSHEFAQASTPNKTNFEILQQPSARQIHAQYAKLLKQIKTNYEARIRQNERQFSEVLNILMFNQQAFQLASKIFGRSERKDSKDGSAELEDYFGSSPQKVELRDVEGEVNILVSPYEELSEQFQKNIKIHTKINEQEESFKKMEKHYQAQIALLKQRQMKMANDFNAFMKCITESGKENAEKSKKNTIQTRKLIKDIGSVAFDIAQCFPLGENQNTQFIPETQEQLFSVLGEIRNFGKKYQEQQRRIAKERVNLQKSFFGVIQKFVKQLQVPKEDVLKILKTVEDMPNLKNMAFKSFSPEKKDNRFKKKVAFTIDNLEFPNKETTEEG